MPNPREPKPRSDTTKGGQADDNIDDLGRDVTDGSVDKKRHPQADADVSAARRQAPNGASKADRGRST